MIRSTPHTPPATASAPNLSEILEELHDEVYVYTTDTLDLIFANKSARRRCDWTRQEVHERRIHDTSDLFDADSFHKHVAPLQSGQTEAVTIETLHEKGLVEITTRILPDVAGQPAYVSVLRDREHRRQLETARAQAFSEIVHDLRTPLTSIHGALKLLEAGAVGDLPPQAQNLLDLVKRNADNMLSIVGDILDLQKYGAETETAEKEPVDLVALCKEAAAAHLGYCAIHAVQIELTAAPDEAWIEGIPLRLHQMLANLLSNAIKYSPKGETVDIALHANGRDWQIDIANVGPGIPEDMRERIFQNYVHAPSPQGTKVKGTGLGLAICKKIIKSHGGEIDYSCDTGSKTVFHVTLPKAAGPDTNNE